MLTLLTSSAGRLKIREDSRLWNQSAKSSSQWVTGQPLLLKLFLFFQFKWYAWELVFNTFFIKIKSILGNSIADELKYHNYDLQTEKLKRRKTENPKQEMDGRNWTEKIKSDCILAHEKHRVEVFQVYLILYKNAIKDTQWPPFFVVWPSFDIECCRTKFNYGTY